MTYDVTKQFELDDVTFTFFEQKCANITKNGLAVFPDRIGINYHGNHTSIGMWRRGNRIADVRLEVSLTQVAEIEQSCKENGIEVGFHDYE
jgi:hypothetical protein